jgi:hypothetical protein
MSATKGYYSLIQYCPDLGRLEAANIGVLLFCPERHFLKALTTGNNRRIIHFFGSEGHDWARINAFKQGLEDRLAVEGPEIHTLEELEHFIAQRANLIQITAPRPMKVFDALKDLDELFRELIGDVPRRGSTKGLHKLIGERFSSAGLDPKIRRGIKVTVPVWQREVEIPFGFQNGRFNLINPVRFGASDADRSVETACKYAVEGKSLHDNPDPNLGNLQLIIVGKFRQGDQDAPAKVKRVFHEYDVKLYRTTELPQLIDEVRRTGKVIESLEDRGV